MFHKTTLKNGLRILTIPQEGTKTVTVLVLAGTGSKYEKREISGISHLLEHMVFTGTEKRPRQQDVAEPLDRVGGIYNAFTGEEYTGFFAKVDSKHFDLAADVVSDIFLNPRLRQQDLEKEKGVVIEEINMYYDNPVSYVQTLWGKLLYGDQPAGWGILGTKESVSGISRENLADYIKSQYSAKNVIVCVAGNIPDKNVIEEKIKKYFSKISEAKYFEKTKTKEEQDKPECILQTRKTDQAHFCLGVRAYNLFHPLRYAQEILATALGGMMSSRLFIKIREELGMAYYISTSAMPFTDCGYLVTQAGVDTKRIETAISAVLGEYKKIAEKGIPEDELKKSKDHLTGKMTLLLEASDAQASFYGLQDVLEKEILTPEQTYDKINKVSSSDVRKVAKDIFRPQKLNLALIGPFEDKEKFLKLIQI